MRSVLDDARARTAALVLAMSMAGRIRLALTLGDEDLARFVRTSGLDPVEARRRIRAQRAYGRVPSVAALD